MSGAKLSAAHMQHGEVCPMLGPMPACIIVFLGYALVFIAGLYAPKALARKLFIVGWTPIFLLALIGVSLELIKGSTCPAGAWGVPQCVFSLVMALVCLGLFWGLSKFSSRGTNNISNT